MSFQVYLTDDAVEDLNEVYDGIASHDSPEKAEYGLTRLEECLDSLSENPERGSYPGELLDVGIRDYCEIYFKPYRMIYYVAKKAVYVMIIADGCRDMQSLLQRRLLRG